MSLFIKIEDMRKFLQLLLVLSIVAFYSCTEKMTSSLVANQSPVTHLFLYPDSTVSKQQSKLTLHWWADDPDGIVIGYYITWDGTHWDFTTRNDSTIAFPIQGSDTVYNFKVAGVDNYGNGIYDNQHTVNSMNFGPEPFTDADGNGVYTNGESFVDIGNIDPNPATVKLPLKNTAPKIEFLKDKTGFPIALPDTTFTVASFGWEATDIDGDETIQKYYISLNDTSKKIEIPGSTRFITLKAVAPFSSEVVSCDVYLGASIKDPYPVKLPNLKLNAKNTFYMFAVDIANAKSNMLLMPEPNKTWYVKKPTGKILIIDDNANADNSAAFYAQILDSLNFTGKYDVLDIKYGKTATVPASFLPKYITPMFTETLKLFKCVFWYSDNDPTLDVAQATVSNYTDAGGKILFSMVFPQSFDTKGLSDFLPLEGVSASPISFIGSNTPINATQPALALGYKSLMRDNQGTVARIWTFTTNSLTTTDLYTIGITGSPVIGFKRNDGNIVFIGLPLNRLNGGSANVKSFFQKVLVGEFGVNP